jgi:hypothetical protein
MKHKFLRVLSGILARRSMQYGTVSISTLYKPSNNYSLNLVVGLFQIELLGYYSLYEERPKANWTTIANKIRI